MARVKISELNEKTQLNDNDLIPVVDSINNETKKVKYSTLFNNNIAVVTGTAQLQNASSGSYEKYFHLNINFPAGFNYQNCIVIGARCWYIPIPTTSFDVQGIDHYKIFMYLGDTIGIEGVFKNIGEEEATCTVVLMRIE